MTVENCKLRLEVAKKANNEKDVEFWEKRLIKKGGKLEVQVKPDVDKVFKVKEKSDAKK